jgi:hypothetical protein
MPPTEGGLARGRITNDEIPKAQGMTNDPCLNLCPTAFGSVGISSFPGLPTFRLLRFP